MPSPPAAYRDAIATPLLHRLLFSPERRLTQTPAVAGLEYEDLQIPTEDGERLHGWWIRARAPRRIGHILLFHGNAGNIADRVLHAELLAARGFDLLLFDYRGYGRSTGRPSERGTYCDARAALTALLARPDVDRERVFYLGESLGAAVALHLALDSPPRGLVLHAAFTGIRDAARRHYPFIPTALVPDAYPSLRLISDLRAPVLLIHGGRDDIVPLLQAEALLDAAPRPKRLEVFDGAGHNDLLSLHGARWAQTIAGWVAEQAAGPPL